MKNNKAFSLIELIAVLIILSLLLLLAVPQISGLVRKNKLKSFNTKVNVIIRQVKQYAKDNESFLNESNKTYEGYVCNTITVAQLKNLGYLKELDKDTGYNKITDPRDNSSMENFTVMLYIKTKTNGDNTNKFAGTVVGTIENTSGCKSNGDIYLYTKKEEVFTAPVAGTYKIEAWGAQGGSASNTYHGGYGGYATATIELAEGEQLYINVGGEGDVTLQTGVVALGGYNGGGIAMNEQDASASIKVGSGGGASSVALESGLLSSFASDPTPVLVVAGGGGGGKYYSSGNHGTGGSGGGFKGTDTKDIAGQYGKGASQTEGGCNSDNWNCSSFGKANMPGSYIPVTGGGGGYYGGGGGYYGGGGGSGYVGHARLSNQQMYCYKCEESAEASTKTNTTNCVDASAKANCSKKGSGAVKISHVS